MHIWYRSVSVRVGEDRRRADLVQMPREQAKWNNFKSSEITGKDVTLAKLLAASEEATVFCDLILCHNRQGD